MEAGEPMPRLVFGGVPSFQEAKDAIAELKDALDKVYLSSSESTGSVDPFAANPSLSLVSGPTLETVISDVTPTPVPRDVFQALSLFSGSPEVQNVVASIASDTNVLNAMRGIPAIQDFFVSLRRNDEFQDVRSDVQSPQPFEESSAESQPGNSDSWVLGKLKVLLVYRRPTGSVPWTVVAMVDFSVFSAIVSSSPSFAAAGAAADRPVIEFAVDRWVIRRGPLDSVED
uniref:Uncharacterized protein n=1 Tax=Fagus sylvatica TaxID=28930 RepID=A0A2N9HKM7_FAGSY